LSKGAKDQTGTVDNLRHHHVSIITKPSPNCFISSTVATQAMQFPKDTSKLKKHVALLCDRLGKGSRLDLQQTSSSSNLAPSPRNESLHNSVLESVQEERSGI
jgi:hypothetical protein